MQRAFIAAALSCVVISSFATCVTLAWDPSPNTQVATYNLYFGELPAGETNKVQASAATGWRLCGLVGGKEYWLQATAVDSSGAESSPSNVVTYFHVPNEAPQSPGPVPDSGQSQDASPRLRIESCFGLAHLMVDSIPGTTFLLEASDDLTNWREVRSFSSRIGRVDYTDWASVRPEARFFRARLRSASTAPSPATGPEVAVGAIQPPQQAEGHVGH